MFRVCFGFLAAPDEKRALFLGIVGPMVRVPRAQGFRPLTAGRQTHAKTAWQKLVLSAWPRFVLFAVLAYQYDQTQYR